MEEPAMAMANAAKLECSENFTQCRFCDPAKLEPSKEEIIKRYCFMFHMNFETDLLLVLLGVTMEKIPPTSHISSLLRCLFMFNLQPRTKNQWCSKYLSYKIFRETVAYCLKKKSAPDLIRNERSQFYHWFSYHSHLEQCDVASSFHHWNLLTVIGSICMYGSEAIHHLFADGGVSWSCSWDPRF